MIPLANVPAEYAVDALAGFAAANADRVLPVMGGVVRATASPAGQVAIVSGGGSGHFPAFAGWIGTGFVHGAACGSIFASPSTAQILSVARAADNGGGILFAPINYAGDILNFGAAAEQLRAEGIDTRFVAITDDIASGGPGEHASRRGIAGSLIVLKVAGAAAERGDSLAEVARIATVANEATRTLGVAFSGCTLPGAAAPLFDVPRGRVAIGLGIHGEPGLSEEPLGTADDVADLVVDRLFDERPPVAGGAVAVVVNGLGSTKYDELFIVFSRVRARLEAEGMRLVAPVVGEYVTSLDMAGFSVSLGYLDDELEGLWTASADAAAFTRGAPQARPRREAAAAASASPAGVELAAGSDASRAAAATIVAIAAEVRDLLAAESDRLGAIDAVAGDGDHGAGMTRGATAAARAAQAAAAAGAGAGAVLGAAGRAWADESGGTSGALWGTGLAVAGAVVGDVDAPAAATVVAAAEAFARGIRDRGGAEPGEKTMVDAIVPFAETLRSAVDAGEEPLDAWRRAAADAERAAAATADIVSSRGRSRIHGERSLGTPDAGATSFALVVARIGASDHLRRNGNE